MTPVSCGCCFIIPPYILRALASHENAAVRERALATLAGMRRVHQLRAGLASVVTMPANLSLFPKKKTRRIFDCQQTSDLSRELAMREGDAPSTDIAVREAYDHSGITWDFFDTLFGRNSIDNRGMTIVSSVHYSENGGGFDNAFWDGRQMVYGDGDEIFGRMTMCLDVVAHELTHGITQYSAGLPYENQSGALNEHFSDVFGVTVRQWHQGQRDPATANWSIGDGLLLTGGALRSMAAPGTAFDGDRQPAHMDDFRELPDDAVNDYGGVHINSGIPNKAFHLAAIAIGKPTWEVVAKIWYVTLTRRLKGETSFATCGYETISVARDYFDDAVAAKVAQAWVDVGVLTAGTGPMSSLDSSSFGASAPGGQVGDTGSG